jgi:(1->4)-alpha-D-glucan 1-alpha-D-glucosylmutase
MLLSEIAKLPPQRAPELLPSYSDGKAKLYVIYKALQFRKNRRSLFEEGEYLPLAIKGTYAEHVVAFCRRKTDTCALIVVPRFLTGLLHMSEERSAGSNTSVTWGNGALDWADTYISLPEGAPARWIDAFTDKILLPCCGRLSLRDVLDGFPVALLWGDGNG